MPDKAPRKYTPRAPSDDHTPMFKVREEESAFIHTLTSTEQTKEARQQRQDVSQRVPALLCEKRNLTTAELESIGWTQVGRKNHWIEVSVNGKLVRFPFAAYLDEERIYENGVWGQFTRMQEIAMMPSFQHRLRRITKKPTATYELGFSVQPGNNRKEAIMLSRTGKVDDEEFHEMRQLVATTGNALVASTFPELSAMLKRRWCLDASLTIGHKDSLEDNWTIHGLQMNFTNMDKIEEDCGKSENLGDFGGLHMDGLDDPARVTVILNLSHLPERRFPGRFNITTARITIPTAPFTAIIFRGTHPHFATGFGNYAKDLPIDSPLRYRRPENLEFPTVPRGLAGCRIVAVGYPKGVLARPGRRHVKETMWSDQAIQTFGTRTALQEWLMRIFLKERLQNIKETEEADKVESEINAEDIRSFFTYTDDDGDEHLPRLWVAQTMFDWYGVQDLEWEDACNAATLVSIGKKYISPKTGGLVKCVSEIWTDADGIAIAAPQAAENANTSGSSTAGGSSDDQTSESQSGMSNRDDRSTTLSTELSLRTSTPPKKVRFED